MRRNRRICAMLALALGCLAEPVYANEDDNDWSALTGQWWQWALSTPAAFNQVADATGASCMVGQRGPVWFLAGAFSGQPTLRTCTVPAGVPLFFPVINNFNFNSPGCFQDNVDLSVNELRALVSPAIDGATGLSVLLDNQPIRPIRRVRSTPWFAVLPPANVFSELFGVPCLVPGQIYSPAVDDGFYARVDRLSVGQHHLSIKGISGGGFVVDVFYTLNVVPVARK